MARFSTNTEAEAYLHRHKVKISDKVIQLNSHCGLRVLGAISFLINHFKDYTLRNERICTYKP